MDDDFDGGESEPFSVCSSPLSEPVNTIVRKASSRATNGNTISFNSTESIDPEYVHSGGKTYLVINHTANIRKGTAPSWIWDHGSELRLLVIPAMSAECERVFSSAKKMITAERNQLTEDIIQACECLKSWWDNGIIE